MLSRAYYQRMEQDDFSVFPRQMTFLTRIQPAQYRPQVLQVEDDLELLWVCGCSV